MYGISSIWTTYNHLQYTAGAVEPRRRDANHALVLMSIAVGKHTAATTVFNDIVAGRRPTPLPPRRSQLIEVSMGGRTVTLDKGLNARINVEDGIVEYEGSPPRQPPPRGIPGFIVYPSPFDRDAELCKALDDFEGIDSKEGIVKQGIVPPELVQPPVSGK